MNPKVAIVLHGPPGTGKSTVSTELRRRLSARHVSLDDGWAPGEFRHSGGSARYADLANATEAVLLVEVGCGEPLDLGFPGATRGAAEWFGLLQQSGREVFGIRLFAESSDATTRIEERLDRWIAEGKIAAEQKLGLFWNFLGLHFLYNTGHPTAMFPELSGFTETTIMTTGRTVTEVADQIVAIVGLQ